MTTLGHVEPGLEDKIAARVHQAWCGHGHVPDVVQTTLGHDRQVFADMGVELRMASLLLELHLAHFNSRGSQQPPPEAHLGGPEAKI